MTPSSIASPRLILATSRLKVRVGMPNARVWTRAGYFAPKG
jgi:hypothetical protein